MFNFESIASLNTRLHRKCFASFSHVAYDNRRHDVYFITYYVFQDGGFQWPVVLWDTLLFFNDSMLSLSKKWILYMFFL